MSCSTCLPLSCVEPDDLSAYSLQSTQFFTNPTFGFVLDCPAGYYCPWRNRTIIINQGSLPPVYVPNNPTSPITIRCCGKNLSANIPAGSTDTQKNIIVHNLFAACAKLEADCINTGTGPPGFPPPFLLPAGGITVEIGNDEQCYTTSSGTCPPGEVQKEAVTICVPADTFTQGLFAPSPQAYDAAKALLNSQAALSAQDQAEAAQQCGWYNVGNSYSNGCPCSPGCGFHGPYGWTWSANIFFSTVSQADANAKANCAACDELYALCLADGCPAGSCLTARNSCAPNPCPS